LKRKKKEDAKQKEKETIAAKQRSEDLRTYKDFMEEDKMTSNAEVGDGYEDDFM